MRRLLLLLLVLTLACCGTSNKENSELKPDSDLNAVPSDFDFFLGSWKIKNRVLNARLEGSNEWSEFEATSKVSSLEGLGNYDEFSSKAPDGSPFLGLSVRMYDPDKKEWTIYWADNFNLESGLTEQVKGSFSNHIGTFYGKEIFNNDSVELRFMWFADEKKPKWEQAYFDENKNNWETNWTMEFSPLDESESIPDIAPKDFDFLIGDWNIENKVLKDRLAGSTEWNTSVGQSSIYKVIGGYGILDEFQSGSEPNVYHGLGIKLYNGKANFWNIYWVDNSSLQFKITPQVTGNFENSIANFIGKEWFKDDSVNMKFIWKDINTNTFTWEQSYFDRSGMDWEVNWISSYSRQN